MKVEKINLVPTSETSKKEEIKLDHLDLTEGFTCDVETGICGPTEVVKENINIEEGK